MEQNHHASAGQSCAAAGAGTNALSTSPIAIDLIVNPGLLIVGSRF
jgi:hypothetical protein